MSAITIFCLLSVRNHKLRNYLYGCYDEYMKILVTGFEPFGTDLCNPSGQVLDLLADEIEGVKIIKAVLPVVRYESLRKAEELIEEYEPDMVLSLGLAGGRAALTPERTAVNVDDFRIGDNKGNEPHDEKIVSDGPDAYFTALPYRAMIEAMKEEGIPAVLSESAGTFVCNHLFYGLRHYCESEHQQIRSGFMHIPYSSEMGIKDKPSLPLAEIARGVTAALVAMIRARY